ncbi:carbohydrate porin [Sphingomonas nostoxanthinifaciens]|uniref:carbohydrate porin n=1 Tax=Sphingomonas nostoxanthinifaciens TaxID=2872652 RepID=UPI001CC1DC0C|nr:carbohydrate porin [Sphingomonas nostoxanthinifaciens]UAK25255.1 carbohydrate porin [Sphingomonas nostoxanthinifaciens]
MRRWWSTAAIAAATILVARPAFAQSQAQPTSDATAKAGETAAASGDASPAEHLFGDWGGVRTRLVDAGIDLMASYLSETAGVASGGLRRGVAYADQEKLQADIDLETLVNLKGWSVHGTLLSRHGYSASSSFLGDDLDAVQEIYGATGNANIHLGQLYLQHMSGGPIGVDVKFGRLPVGADFNTSPLYCGFLSLGMCPQPRGQSIDGSFSVDPSSTWGGRLKLGEGHLSIAAGAYQVRPRYGGPSGFDWGLSNTTGYVVPVEAVWSPSFGPGKLQGHYKLGLTYDSSDRPDLTPGGTLHSHSVSYYASFDQMLIRIGKGGADGVMLLGGWTHADPDTAIFRDYGFIGLVARGIVPSRPADALQLLATHGWISHSLTDAQRVALVEGMTLPTGFAPAPGSFAGPATAPGVQTATTVYEANYAMHVARGLILTPDFQYVVHPGAATSVPNATIFAGRAEIDF